MPKSEGSDKDSKDNHVFIVGLPRTGTSIMYRTIQKLPSFCTKQLNLWETNIFRDNITFDMLHTNYKNLSKYISDNDDIFDLFLELIKNNTDILKTKNENISYAIPFENADNVPDADEFKRIIAPVEFRWRQSSKIKIIREYFNFAREYRNSKRLVEKTPHHYLNVHQIIWTFPEAKVLWMIRHPIEVFTSSIKRSKIDESYSHYWDVDLFISEFKASFFLLAAYQRQFAQNIMLVKYEDFVNQPKKELKNICEFIDEPFDINALAINKSEIINWKPDIFLFGRIVNKTEKNWREHITAEDAVKIEKELQNFIKEYSYIK